MLFTKVLGAAILAASLVSFVEAQNLGVGGIPEPKAGAGKQFTTGPCKVDNDCQSSCCDGKKCRSPTALKQNEEFCGNGFTNNFNPALNKPNQLELNKAKQATILAALGKGAKRRALADLNLVGLGGIRPPTPIGKQFTTGPCKLDSECLEGCCDGKKCRAPGALKQNVEFCRNGFTTNFNVNANAPNQLDLNKKAVAAQLAAASKRRALADLNLVGLGGIRPPTPVGKQFTTGPCKLDSECLEGCCDGKKCRAPGALKQNVEFCRNGFTPNFNVNANAPNQLDLNKKAVAAQISAAGQKVRRQAQLIGVGGIKSPPPGTGTKFITAPCKTDNECSSGCCDGKKCRAPPALKQNEEFCRNGFTTNFNPERNKPNQAALNKAKFAQT